jgi:tetratricopeptide (TPR) repeat protein
MWANRPAGGRTNWNQATSYCASLSLGGYSGWRLPTLDEAKASTTFKDIFPDTPGVQGAPLKHSAIIHNPADDDPRPYTDSLLKGVVDVGVWTLWTSTKAGDWAAWAIDSGRITTEDIGRSWGYMALCVRPMEADLLQVAKDAQVTTPVPDVQTLKAYMPIAQAHASFKAAQYQAAIIQANGALAIEPKFAPAYWAMGVSYGMLGQWDQAVANLQSAVKIDKNYNDGRAALKWAQEGQKAAKKGESPKDKPPVWK